MSTPHQNKRVAFCFSGQVRTLERCYDTFKTTLFSKIKNPIDIFCHFYENAPLQAQEERLVRNLLNPKVVEFDQPPVFNNEKIQRMHRHALPGAPVAHTVRVMNQLYSIMKANNLKKKYEIENEFKYDVVFRIRPDQLYLGLLEDMSTVSEGEIYVPDHDWHLGGINDRFCFGKSETIDKFSQIYSELDTLITMGRFHPETMAKNICRKHNIKVIKTDIKCNRVREDGSIIPLYY